MLTLYSGLSDDPGAEPGELLLLGLSDSRISTGAERGNASTRSGVHPPLGCIVPRSSSMSPTPAQARG